MKVKNRLLNFNNTVIYQNDDWFLFSLDSVLLANFVTIKPRDKKIIDFCCGNAPVPMMMTFRTNAKITGVEIQKEIYDLGIESINENNMNDQISLINDDVNNLNMVFDAETFDVVTCNPPYFKYQDDSFVNENDIKTIARHEVKLNLEEMIKMGNFLLKNGGTIAFVHRPERLIEIINIMKKYNIEPKKIRLVYPKIDKDANILLIEGTKNGKSGLKVMAPLISHKWDDTYNEEIRKMFGDELDVAM